MCRAVYKRWSERNKEQSCDRYDHRRPMTSVVTNNWPIKWNQVEVAFFPRSIAKNCACLVTFSFYKTWSNKTTFIRSLREFEGAKKKQTNEERIANNTAHWLTLAQRRPLLLLLLFHAAQVTSLYIFYLLVPVVTYTHCVDSSFLFDSHFTTFQTDIYILLAVKHTEIKWLLSLSLSLLFRQETLVLDKYRREVFESSCLLIPRTPRRE